MDGKIIGGNGPAPQEAKPLVVTLILRPTPGGYTMEVQHDPAIFADVVIDACYRAGRYYERLAMIQELSNANTRAMQAQQNAIDIRKRLS